MRGDDMTFATKQKPDLTADWVKLVQTAADSYFPDYWRVAVEPVTGFDEADNIEIQVDSGLWICRHQVSVFDLTHGVGLLAFTLEDIKRNMNELTQRG